MTHLLVLGATGKTGQQLVDQALARGWRVRAFVRNPDAFGRRHANLEVVRGDMHDRASLDAAMQGVDAVVSGLGIFSRQPTTAMADGARQIAGAMQAHGVRRIVIVSSLGAGESRNQGPFMVRIVQNVFLNQVLIDKTNQENVLRASGLEWTSLRPPKLVDDAAVREDVVVWSGPTEPARRLTWKVARATVAKLALDAIEQRRWIGEAICLSDPA